MPDHEPVDSDTTRIISEEQLQRLRQNLVQKEASLVVLAGWEIGKEIKLEGPEIIIGRAPTAQVVISEASVSRHHAKIERVLEGDTEHFRVSDMDSMNGTHVNSVPIQTEALRNGDRLMVGDVLFKFVLHDPVEAQYHREIHRLINYDQLTGLMTMDSFRRTLEEALQRAVPGTPMTIAMTDLDGLKRVNDTHGHLAGRMIVREMGVMIRASLRPQDKAGLYGGDEGIMLYPETPVEQACQVAETIRTTIESRRFEHNGATFGVTISQGLAEWPRHGRSVNEIIAAADGALYAAKAAGRNCIKICGS